MEAKTIILKFIEKYNACQPYEYNVARWPDEENRQSRDIDAIAEASNEHLTSSSKLS